MQYAWFCWHMGVSAVSHLGLLRPAQRVQADGLLQARLAAYLWRHTHAACELPALYAGIAEASPR